MTCSLKTGILSGVVLLKDAHNFLRMMKIFRGRQVSRYFAEVYFKDFLNNCFCLELMPRCYKLLAWERQPRNQGHSDRHLESLAYLQGLGSLSTSKNYREHGFSHCYYLQTLTEAAHSHLVHTCSLFIDDYHPGLRDPGKKVEGGLATSKLLPGAINSNFEITISCVRCATTQWLYELRSSPYIPFIIKVCREMGRSVLPVCH